MDPGQRRSNVSIREQRFSQSRVSAAKRRQPRPTNGIFVGKMLMYCTLVSIGRLAM